MSVHDHRELERVPEGVWEVDPSDSRISFKTRAMLGLVAVTGLFERFAGELAVDAEGNASGGLMVETASLGTGVDKRDQHLRSADFFNTDQNPHMVFTVERFTPGRERPTLSGSLQIRDTTIPLEFPVTVIEHGDHLHMEGRVTIDHDAAGLAWARPGMIGRTARADLALTLHHKSA